MSDDSVACPLCKKGGASLWATAHDIEYFTSTNDFDFYRCEACDVLFISPMLSSDLSTIYPKNYYSFAGQKPSLVQRIKQVLDRRAFRAVSAEIPGQDLAALDVGGGSGWLLNQLRQVDDRFTHTCVVDIDPGAGALAEAAGHRFDLGSIEDFSANRSFDLVFMLNLIEHVADPERVLRKAADMLSANGRLLLKTPNFDALDARLFRHHSWAGLHTPRHFVLFTRESLVDLCLRSGLEVVSFHYTQGAPFWSVSVLDLLRRAGLVKVDAARPAVMHPLIPPLQALFAAFDFLRRPFARLSQMELVLRKI
ncbi:MULTISPECIES: class I SAM-dependent methyltransferase [unclassified Beijerinckia]|uniref:class I SAM-dependent methyltransferase n=1 Tax=unclassified Beijerinckia TaxID=2638183 RepID=UPI00089872AF|nr:MULTISPECIES: class I SAM-dependent methyltransferase [unclassified Beijerinckia]MDH7799662.1 2-polyprenyl-3-methyl-5-hydroxy-6-metoxy-1,4-benzoquinol methylase [Beijerinckia sp. GAS462]SEB48902.1 Methyltransferase domain-containing protein [Beijerinckia sp. 28-YEA-48]